MDPAPAAREALYAGDAERVLELLPSATEPEQVLLRVQALRLLGRVDEADAELAALEARAEGPDLVLARVHRARLLRDLGELGAAEEVCRSAAALGAEIPDGGGEAFARRELAAILAVAGRFRLALDELAAARALSCTDLDAYDVEMVTGNLGLRSGRPEVAVAAYQQAARLARDLGRNRLRFALQGLARAHTHLGQHGLAVARIDEAVALLDPAEKGRGPLSTWSVQGFVLRSAGRLDEAVRAFRRALSVARELGIYRQYVHLDLAMVLLESGQIGRAAETAAKVVPSVELNPTALAQAHLLQVPHAALGGRVEQVDAAIRIVRPWVLGRLVVEPDVATAARLAALGCPPALRDQRVALHAIALHAALALGMSDRVDAEARALAALGGPVPLGPFLLDERVGAGAMGEVWAGRHRASGARVAVKVLASEHVPDVRAVAGLQREVRALARLDHPGIVRILDAGLVDAAAAAAGAGLVEGTPYVVMEHVAGGTLLTRCGQLPPDACRRILLDLLDALGHAHARGVLHLDLKPENVLMDGERPRLVDFGLAHAVGDPARRGVAGTPPFMAPEQFEAGSRRLGPWTDLYGLGCLATMLLTGAPPFGHGSLDELRQAHLYREPTLPRPVPAELAPFLAGLLEKDPRDRYRSAAEAASALRGAAPPAAPSPFRWLPDAGWSLLEHRKTPPVARERERLLLRTALEEVVRRRGPRGVVIEGAAGSGARHLARWLAEEAHARGIAAPLVEDEGEVVSWEGRAPLAEVAGLVARVGAEQVVLLCVEGTPAPACALLDTELPVLVVMAVSGVDPVGDEVLDDPRVLHLPLGPLPDDAVVALLDGLLAISDELARAIAAEAAGSPGRALALLRALIEQGGVIEGERGLERRPGAPIALPTRPDLVERLAGRVRALSDEDREQLGRVAEGQPVDDSGAAARLLDARLVVAGPDGALTLADPALAGLVRPDALR